MSRETVRLMAMDTTTSAGSVALVTEQGILSERFLRSGINHSRRLLSTIDSMLSEAGWDKKGISAIAVCRGPGSFTGLRIGVSTAAGLAYGLKKPLFGVGSLDAIAMNFPFAQYPVCPVIDARKLQVFAAVYVSGPDGRLKKERDAVSVDPEKLAMSLTGEVILAGDGLRLYSAVFRRVMGQRARFAPENLWYSRASIVGLAALERYLAGEMPAPDELRAEYVRLSDAELNAKSGGEHGA